MTAIPDDVAQRVLDHVEIMAPAMVEDLRELVRVPSIGGTAAEVDAVASMAARLETAGLEVDHWRIDLDRVAGLPGFPGMEVERDEAWGCVGRLPGAGGVDGARSVLLDGHVDVVPVGDPSAWAVDPFGAERRDGHVLGRGTADMKGGLMAQWWAVQAIRAAGVTLAGDVLVAPVCGEEDGGLGTFALLDRGWTADACLVAEPTDLDLVPANSGALTFRLHIPGRAAHAARRLEGVSAVDKLVPVLAALEHLERRRHLDVDPLLDRWALAHPLSIGSVRAGDWASTVPDRCVADGRLGVAVGETVDAARAELESAVAEVCATDPWLRDHPVEVEWWGGQFASGRIDPGSDLPDVVARAHLATTGIAPDRYGAPYGSDLRLLVAAGIATVQYGPGDAGRIHGPEEAVAVDDLVTCARTTALVLLELCGVAAG